MHNPDKFKNVGYLLFMVMLAFSLRFSYLSYNPPSLNWDEVSYGYNAYSVLKTGADQWGQKYPILNFRAYGDYPTTLNLYLTIPFIVVFGLTDLALRFPHALMGSLLVVSFYFLAYGLTKRKDLSLIGAFLVAVGPWYLFPSRFLIQSNLSVFLMVTAAAFFVNRAKKRYFFIISFLFIFLSLFSYHTTRIFTPLLVFVTFLIYRPEIKNKIVYFFIAALLGLSAYILINPESRARGNVLFLVDQSAVNRIIEKRVNSNFPEAMERLIYNRPVYFVTEFTRKYISYFSPQYLFLTGGTQYQFSVPNRGLIYFASLPFFYLGILQLVRLSLRDRNYKFILVWLLLSPIPASLTNESAAVIRATTMLPITEIAIVVGLSWFLTKVPKNWITPAIIIYIFFIIFDTETYLTSYFTDYRTKYSWSWQYGHKEAALYVTDNYQKYDKIITTKKYGEPHEFLLFFMKWDPANYQKDPNKVAYFQDNWYWVDRFDKFYFVNDWDVPKKGNVEWVLESGTKFECLDAKCLLITSPGNYPQGWVKIKDIEFLDGTKGFEIYEN